MYVLAVGTCLTKSLLERALAIQERSLGPDHTEVALTLLGIGSVQEYLGRYLDAELSYLRALAIDEECRGRIERQSILSEPERRNKREQFRSSFLVRL